MIVPESGQDAGRRRPQSGPGLLRGLPDGLDAGMYAVDEQGLIVDVNERAELLLRRPAADLLGRDAHDLLHRGEHGHTLPRVQCTMMHAFVGGRTAQADDGWFQRGDGSVLPVAWLISPYRLGEGAAGEGAAGALVLFHEVARHGTVAGERADRAAALTELDRLSLLAETTTGLTSTLDVDEALRRLVRLVVPRLADWAVVDLIDEGGELWRTAVVHHEGGALVSREDLEGPMPPVPQDSLMPLSRALRGVAPTLAAPEDYQGPPDSGIAVVQEELFRATGIHSAAIAPLRGPAELLGALTLGRADQEGAFDVAELSLVDDIARRAGLALGNARLYERQRRVAETMQRHLLPRLPRVPGLDMAARYLPAPRASQVGGDWYDAFVLPDGATALAIGDVVGHDLDAAAGMAQVRNILRAYAWDRHEPPSVIVGRLDQAMMHITEASMATVVLARVEGELGGPWQLRWTNAGHPPPLLVTHDGHARFLDDGHGILLGTGLDRPRTDGVVPLPPLATVVFYTDGLVEVPGRSIDEGLARLRRYAAGLVHRPLGAFCDELLARVRPGENEDDVALLVLRVPAADAGGR